VHERILPGATLTLKPLTLSHLGARAHLARRLRSAFHCILALCIPLHSCAMHSTAFLRCAFHCIFALCIPLHSCAVHSTAFLRSAFHCILALCIPLHARIARNRRVCSLARASLLARTLPGACEGLRAWSMRGGMCARTRVCANRCVRASPQALAAVSASVSGSDTAGPPAALIFVERIPLG